MSQASVVCEECSTPLGGDTGKDPYKHLLHCLHVEPDNLERVKEAATVGGGEHNRRILHLVDAILGARQLVEDGGY